LSSKNIKITVEYNNLHETFEGNADETIKALMLYIYRIYPELEIISKLLWKPDIQKLLELVSEYAKLNVEGDIIFIKSLQSCEQSLLIVLTIAYLGHKLGKRDNEFLSILEISNTINKAEKTIRNTVTELLKSNLIERIDKGCYRITANGLRKIDETLNKKTVRIES
jgi:hypothetical protein